MIESYAGPQTAKSFWSNTLWSSCAFVRTRSTYHFPVIHHKSINVEWHFIFILYALISVYLHPSVQIYIVTLAPHWDHSYIGQRFFYLYSNKKRVKPQQYLVVFGKDFVAPQNRHVWDSITSTKVECNRKFMWHVGNKYAPVWTRLFSQGANIDDVIWYHQKLSAMSCVTTCITRRWTLHASNISWCTSLTMTSNYQTRQDFFKADACTSHT